jgi:hypothetical protein
LVVFFHEGTDIHVKAQGGATGRLLVGQDDIADAIVEDAELGLGIRFEIGRVLGPGGGEGTRPSAAKEKGEEDRKADHEKALVRRKGRKGVVEQDKTRTCNASAGGRDTNVESGFVR